MAFGRFSSADSFAAVLGSANSRWLGAGVQLELSRRFFVRAGVSRFRAEGHRAFVFGDTVYSLDVPNKVSILPVTAIAAYRLPLTSRVSMHVGGGIGTYMLREQSPGAVDDENAWRSSIGYQILGGVELPVNGWVHPAIEGVYEIAPGALARGVASALNQRGLGGLQVRARLIFGR